MGFDSLAVRWLVATVVYFVTFVVLMDVFLMGGDWSMILNGAVLFSLVVSTISILLMWKKNAKSLPYYDTIFASGIAGLLLIGTMPPDGQAIGGWSLSSLLLMGVTVGIGAAGRWVYATVTSSVRRAIRERSTGDGGR
jgi:hypothetical protein